MYEVKSGINSLPQLSERFKKTAHDTKTIHIQVFVTRDMVSTDHFPM